MKISRVMSGMRASGSLHFGHYFGTLRNWLLLQDQYQCFFGVMDWHGMTTKYRETADVLPSVRDMYAEFLAWGLNPEKSTIFVQSLVPQHLELFMILANLTPMGWLERVPTWKDAEVEAKQSDTHNLGRFSYPVLQAADVAIYKGEKVPVGADQVSHLELTREIVRRFNHIYKAKWPEPAALLTDTPAVPGLDGRKMSKSYNNAVGLTEDPKTRDKRVKTMPTDPARVRREDPGEPTKCTVYSFHRLFSKPDDWAWVEAGCRSAGIGCGDCKGRLLERVEELVKEPRERKKELMADGKKLDEMIHAGSAKAAQEAAQNIREIKELMKIRL